MMTHQPLFSTLTPEALQRIATHGVTRRYPKQTIVITEGEDNDSLYVIMSGRVKAFLGDESGKEITLSIQGPGECFGELALIDSAPRSASVMTLDASEMAVISRADFRQCLAENPEIALELIGSLTARVRALTENVRSLALMDVYGRVARTLLSLARERDEDGTMLIDQRLTHQEIANMVGASREMVSRIMKDLSTGGYIKHESRKIVIPGKLPRAW